MKPFILSNSTRQDKRYMVKTDDKTIHFGSPDHDNYIIHKDAKRKDSYINRHSKTEDWTKQGIYTAGFWSRWLLWEKPSLFEAINNIEKKFNIKIVIP